MALVCKLFASAFLIPAVQAEAGETGFLRGPSTQAQVEASLAGELAADGAKQVRISAFMQDLSPSYTALPKNKDGHLEHQTVRYLLHRFFVQRHSWYIKGLEPDGDVFHANASADSFKDWVPSYLLGQLEKKLDHRGLNLNDVAALAAALEDVIQEEASELVKGIFMEGRAGTSDMSVLDALLVYTASFLSNHHWTAEVATRSKDRFVKEYHDWNRTQDWLTSLEQEHLQRGSETGVEMAAKVAIDIGARYGSFNDKQCVELKGALLGMWSKGKATGRVRLADFYKMGLDTQWDLVEKREYLNALGALDDSNASNPLVIIANYLTARPNCLDATNLYATCCPNECEGLLGSLEKQIAAPSASPEVIVELIRTLGSDTVQAPREVDASLVERLQQLAEQHGGKVKLHGRLFAQWMHHVYPNECPYPHEAGTADPTSPDQWMGEDVAASEEEMRKYVDSETCGPEQAAREWTVEVPWSATEELVADHVEDTTGAGADFLCVVVLLLVGLGAAALALSGLSGRSEVVAKLSLQVRTMGVRRQHVLFAGLGLLLVVTNMVNIKLLAVLVCVGMLAQHLFGMEMPCIDKQAGKLDKCMV